MGTRLAHDDSQRPTNRLGRGRVRGALGVHASLLRGLIPWFSVTVTHLYLKQEESSVCLLCAAPSSCERPCGVPFLTVAHPVRHVEAHSVLRCVSSPRDPGGNRTAGLRSRKRGPKTAGAAGRRPHPVTSAMKRKGSVLCLLT